VTLFWALSVVLSEESCFNALGHPGVTGFNIWSIFVAFLGAVVVLVLYHTLSGTSPIRLIFLYVPDKVLIARPLDYPLRLRCRDDFVASLKCSE